MEINELKSHSRPRRSPSNGHLEIRKLSVRNKDVVTGGVRYKITARSRANPLTHWIGTPLSEVRNGHKYEPIELSETQILEAIAEQKADQVHICDFAKITESPSVGCASSVSRRFV